METEVVEVVGLVGLLRMGVAVVGLLGMGLVEVGGDKECKGDQKWHVELVH